MTNKTKGVIAGGVVALGTVALLTMTSGSTVWFDTGNSCASQPQIDRVFGEQLVPWGGKQYVFVNEGNDIGIYSSPSMSRIAKSHFGVGNMGDSDYDMYNFSVCDDCQFGVANYKRGTVIFEIGEQSRVLTFLSSIIYRDANLVPGAYTYSEGGNQYLIAAGITDDCDGSALYQVLDVGNLQFKMCLGTPTSTSGVVSGDRVGDYLYLIENTTRVQIYAINGNMLSYVGRAPWNAYGIKDKAQDFSNGLAVVGSTTGLKLYDISSPESPVLVSSAPGEFNRVSFEYPLVFAAKKGFRGSEHTFLLVGGVFVETHQDFWDQTNDWNHPGHQCAEVQSGEWIDGGDKLILSRYAFGDLFDTSGWAGTTPTPTPLPDAIFSDGFESGDTSAW